MRLRPWNRRCAWTRALGLAVVTLTVACQSPTNATTSDANRTTETFTGTLAAGNLNFHLFTVAHDGNLDLTLTSLSPQGSITVGMGVGQPSASGCTLFTNAFSESVKVGSDLSGSIVAGSYCAVIYDIGNVTGSVTYTMTAVHP